MKRVLRALGEWAPVLAAALVLIGLLAAVAVWAASDYRKPCQEWAAESGLGHKATVLTCETGVDSEGDLTKREYQVQQNDALNEAFDIINSDGGL